ncbi:MAG: oligosaccharide flippase family protein [Candidatus Omnitrophica bacterium]|nr:oligosaccharide flippase family protein [Candidatus Omnitrophota bacterium]
MIYPLLKKIGLHSVIYGIGNMSYAIPGFVLIPLYTRFLAPFEYGIYSLLTMLFGILLYIYEFGMVASSMRQFYEHNDEHKRKEVLSTAFFFILIYGVTLTAVLYFFRGTISQFLFKTTGFGHIVAIGLCAVFFQSLIAIPQTSIRLKEKPVLYIILLSGQLLALVVFNILFIAVLRQGLLGIYRALLVVSIIAFLAYLLSALRNFNFRFNFAELKELLYLGGAYFPALLLTWIIDSSDRYILDIFTDLSSVGIYSLGYKIGQVPLLLVKSFALGWLPIMFSIAKSDKPEYVFGKIGTYFVLGISFFVFGLSLYSKEIISILASANYIEAYRVVFLICLSYLFYGLYIFFLTGLTIKKRIYSLPLVLVIGAIVNIALNFLLIPRFGMMGAAVATLISYISIALATYYFSQKCYYIAYEVKKITIIIASGVVIYILSMFFRVDNIFLSAGIKTGFLLTYVISLYLFHIISREDIAKIKSVFARLLRNS